MSEPTWSLPRRLNLRAHNTGERVRTQVRKRSGLRTPRARSISARRPRRDVLAPTPAGRLPSHLRFLPPVLIFLIVLATHASSPVTTSRDSLWSIHVAMSILEESNCDLEEYRDVIIPEGDYRVYEVDGVLQSYFPLGPSLVAVPFVYLYTKSSRALALTCPMTRESLRSASPQHVVLAHHAAVERFIASFVVALTAVIVYLIAAQSGPWWSGGLLAVIFAFATPAWSTASRALWTHASSMLMLSAALYFFLLGRKRPHLVQLAAVPLLLSYFIRPTNSVSVAALSVLVLVVYPKIFPRYLLWALAVVVPFLLLHSATYGAALPPYYAAQRLFTNPDFWQALAGNLISPSRGLFVFSPILLFSLFGLALLIVRRQMTFLDWSLAGVVVAHLVIISSFREWWAGHSYGPRFWCDVTPYLIYFMMPGVAALGAWRGARRYALAITMSAALVASVAIHSRGALIYEPQWWNPEPVNVDAQPERVWDWRDPQFLRLHRLPP